MIFTDRVHLVSSLLGAAGRRELHDFADSIGLKRCWYRRGHYDLGVAVGDFRLAYFAKAIKAGAKMTTCRECARMRRRTMTGVEWHLQRIL